MSRNYFGDSDESGSDFDEDTSGLPFPKPLSRSSFLAPDFDPASFLASLTNRHQTLEDLRLELRELSQSLNKELLDLVNENYQDFLSLGGALKGGEEKVEEVRVGLLGFQRDVAAIQAKVEARRKDVESLLQEKKRYRTQANIAKALLDVAERIEELEERLMIGDSAKQNGQSSEDADPELDTFESGSDDSDEDFMDGSNGVAVISLKKLEHHIQKYVYITAAADRIGNKHPFLVSQQPRLEKIKSTLLLDLNTALEQAKRAGERRDERTLKVLRLYDLLGAESSAIAALKRLTI
ncbi:hypothetical protein VTN77DRAFT_2658 [Rasamsonia byssochlamydoides]|uniref:uncharacterized protein n=1 Tax=Rasamsonia byssochlamydoides TaxID=89139 RepID=UPI003743B91A